MTKVSKPKQAILLIPLFLLMSCDSQNPRKKESATPRDPLSELRASIIGTWYGKDQMGFHYIYTFSENGTVDMKMVVLGEAQTMLEGPRDWKVYYEQIPDAYGDKRGIPIIQISTGGVPIHLAIVENGKVLQGASTSSEGEIYRKYKW